MVQLNRKKRCKKNVIFLLDQAGKKEDEAEKEEIFFVLFRKTEER